MVVEDQQHKRNIAIDTEQQPHMKDAKADDDDDGDRPLRPLLTYEHRFHC